MQANWRIKRLYLDTIRDLQVKVAARDDYSMAKAAGLLRQLILDSPTLLDTVNREFRHKFVFTVAVPRQNLDPYPPTLEWNQVDPEVAKLFGRSLTESLDRDKFLAHPCLAIEGKNYSVRDLISVCANIKGGVHIGTPPPELKDLVETEVFQLGGVQMPFQSICDIAAIFLKGVQSLTDSVEKQLNAAGGS